MVVRVVLENARRCIVDREGLMRMAPIVRTDRGMNRFRERQCALTVIAASPYSRHEKTLQAREVSQPAAYWRRAWAATRLSVVAEEDRQLVCKIDTHRCLIQ